ncbi:MAG TPA: bifunctional riboflavin kinase/FAD synthetase [Polyangia bacterium]|jgi:riboflavin kinase/FMN adenylyltransferase|nr:bifunctional riboflavin kinase/FAD synthetase [Polyangia bacterium]
MKIVRGRHGLAVTGSGAAVPLALAIGNFDGVHRGHQALIRIACQKAASSGGVPAVLTFDPHPAQLFAPALAPPLIVSLERRLELLADSGIAVTVVEPFTPEFAAIEAPEFVREVLLGALGARDVVVGYDFSFGRGRAGNTRTLAELGSALGVGVTVVPPVTVDGLTCSSTKVREFVLEGRVEGAALLLGRPFEITGVVVKGAGRGRGLGFPTANVTPEGELLPRAGIYAAVAVVLDSAGQAQGRFACALSVGTNPTFVSGTAAALSVEAYLLDFDADLYGRRLRIEVRHRLRDEQRFASASALVTQINDDVARTRAMVKPDDV